MDPEEARIWQIALEDRRRARTEFTGIVSMHAEMEASEIDTAHYRAGMETSWIRSIKTIPSRRSLLDLPNRMLRDIGRRIQRAR